SGRSSTARGGGRSGRSRSTRTRPPRRRAEYRVPGTAEGRTDMFAALDMPILPPQASEYAADYDKLFWYITAVTLMGGLGVYAAVIYFCFKYARKPGDRT